MAYRKKLQEANKQQCMECLRTFTRGFDEKRHSIRCGADHDLLKKYDCSICSSKFTRRDSQLKHMRKQHGSGKDPDKTSVQNITEPINTVVVGEGNRAKSSCGGIVKNMGNLLGVEPGYENLALTAANSKKSVALKGWVKEKSMNLNMAEQSETDDSVGTESLKYTIIKQGAHKNLKFRLQRNYTEFKLKPIPKMETNPAEWIKGGIHDIIRYITSDVVSSDKIGMTFSANCFSNSAYMSFKKAADVTFEEVWSMLSSIFQSNSEGLNTDTFVLELIKISDLQGRGRRRKNFYSNFDEECRQRRGIVTINNNDNLCLPRAITVAVARIMGDPEYLNIRKNIGYIQDAKTRELLKASNIQIPAEGCGTLELAKFQQYLTEYKITAYTHGDGGRRVLFEGGNGAMKKINLLYSANHFNVITSLTSAFACKYYCELCHIPYGVKNQHRCIGSCPACQQKPSCVFNVTVNCNDCNREFRSADCFKKHKDGAICDKIRRCSSCYRTINKDREHYCNEIFCQICKKHQPENHLCFMQKDLKRPRTDNVLYIFFDLETRQEKTYQSTEGVIHEPNLCVFNQRCHDCIEKDSTFTTCLRCGIRRMVIKTKPVEIFTQYILNQRKIFNEIIVLAHNSQGFDCQFVLKYIITNTSLKPELLMRGTKIILMNINNIKFIDSLNYFPMSLAALPKAFDLQSIFKKGYFPHLFNTAENALYKGPMPDIKYYSPDTMKPVDRDFFLQWYEDHMMDTFNLDLELVEYCINDVEILTQACLKFRKMMLTECNVCPFSEAMTIASACSLAFRRGYLKADTIGIIPKGGYRKAGTQSKAALKWLIEEAQSRKINILHDANGREVLICGMRVDGFCKDTQQIFEFQGCYFHGHTCLSGDRYRPLREDPRDTHNSRLKRVLEKNNRLRNAGYEVIEMWECQYKSIISDSHTMLLHMQIDPRDAFYGGRTGNTVKHYKAAPGEKIKYFDLCSLYPWVCKYGKFPIGHPTVIIGNDECVKEDIDNIDGVIKCKILPPQDLLHPILPTKMNGKLLFMLCHTCGQSFLSAECDHSEEERALTGTWIMDEVQLAISKGYRMLEIYEIWKYNVDQLNDKSEGLFGCFINKFLKLKQEASGWPSSCTTQEEKHLYLANYLRKEGVQLIEDNIIKNAGLRSLAKLMLNSFWGKFGQAYHPKTALLREYTELSALIDDSSVHINTIREITDDVILVNYDFEEETIESSGRTNVCLAGYTTAQARLKLYTYLDQLKDRVLYFDTDSIIFISREGENDPSTGSYLGDMVDELEEYGPGSYITEFVSGGPKTYAYHIYSPNDTEHYFKCKVKGFTLNHENSQIINFESMKNSISEGDCTGLCVKNYNIKRTKTIDVISENTVKVYKPTSIKRKFLDDGTSVPYGYKPTKLTI